MRILITGGAGFMGSSLSAHLAGRGYECRIFDNLSRPGASMNLARLREAHGGAIEAVVGDVRDAEDVSSAAEGMDAIVHLAAQTAVTTSLEDPATDFEVNARGTLTVLEAARRSPRRPRVVFASTNKVYGDLAGLEIVELPTRYAFARGGGVPEDQPLALHTPYGCSKGAADQYVLDYARVFGLRTLVLRLSCVYGPGQFGTEDQGWVAHFCIAALRDRPITVYGDGRQVRDILYVSDLADLYERCLRMPDRAWGRAYNAGGGAAFAVSLLDVIDLIGSVTGTRPRVRHGPWRPSDQRIYVTDHARITRVTGWAPATPPEAGVRELLAWAAPRLDVIEAAGAVRA